MYNLRKSSKEYYLKNKTISERVEELISVAHPDFRDELREQAIEMNYINK